MPLLSNKQKDFIIDATARWNIAHGSVRSGKTIGTLFRFMEAVDQCPDSQIYMIGHTCDTIYHNGIRAILEDPILATFGLQCAWFPGKRQLTYKKKTITCLGAKDEGAIGAIQGKTFSLVYCDEMTLYPDSVIDMIDTRLSKSYSLGIATCNPSHPGHKIKTWIDKAAKGDKNYYALHFTLDDNPFVPEDYKQRLQGSLTGIFYKRNYLGLWVQADGAIFDFFDRDVYVVDRPPTAADYWVAGIDVGSVNPFCCLLIGVSTGRYTQEGRKMWVEKEYYWDPAPNKRGRQKTHGEFADDMQDFLEPYAVKNIYIDPSAEAFQLELKKRHMPVVHANNDVYNGIHTMLTEMQRGNLLICSEATNLIREIEGYCWDPKEAKKGIDKPLKVNDHAVDCLRYVCASHKVPKYYDDKNFGRTLGFKR